MPSLTLRAEHVFDGHADRGPGSVVVSGGVIAAVEYGRTAPAAEVLDLGAATITPGLVDVHCHGGGGAEFSSDPETVLAIHRAHGTTTQIASLMTAPLEELERQVRSLVPLVGSGELAGIHLEGPWLATEQAGAHRPELLHAPGPDEISRLLVAGEGTIRMVTLAPELAGGLDAVRLLTSRGVVAAIGHTAADFDLTRAAIAAGATGATHLFNAMPALHHRDPGPLLALVADDRVWLELIADGIHVHPALVAETMKRLGDRVVLVTDAMAATGRPDGEHRIGALRVHVRHGVARLVDGGALAGSTLTLDAAVRNAIAAGVGPAQALRSATSSPAAFLGLEAGSITAGRSADLVVWSPEWQLRGVLRHGQWVLAPGD